MQVAETLTAQYQKAVSRNQALLALGISISLHFMVFQTWPHMQGTLQQSMVVDAELLPPVIAEPPPKPEPLQPEPKQETPTPEKTKPKPQEPPPKPVKPDTGVALPVIAEKAFAPASPADYVIQDAPPLAANDKLPFASRTGSVPLAQYRPSDGPSAETKPADPDAEDEVDSGSLGQFSEGLREKASKAGSYPAIALKRGWQGKVKVLVRFNIDGTPRQISVKESSGRKILDEQAIEMVRQACAEMPMPSQLNGKKFSVVVPVDFKLSG